MIKRCCLILFFVLVLFRISINAAEIWSFDFETCADPPSGGDCTGNYCSNQLNTECWGGAHTIETIEGEDAYKVPGGGGYFRRNAGTGEQTEMWVRQWVYFNDSFQWRASEYWKHLIFGSTMYSQVLYLELYGDYAESGPTGSAHWVWQTQGDVQLKRGVWDTWGGTKTMAEKPNSEANGWVYPDSWYLVIVHIKVDDGVGNGNGECDLDVYTEDGTHVVDWDFSLKGGSSGGLTTSEPIDGLKHDFTRNGGIISNDDHEYRDDITYSTSSLGFLARGEESEPESPITGVSIE